MKRFAVIAAAVALFATSATLALADDSDVDADASEMEAMEARELNDAQMLKAWLLAEFLVGDDAEEGDEPGAEGDELDPTEAALEAIIELRTGETVAGWGAIFKLVQLANATDTTLEDLLADVEADGGGWAFGKRFKELEDGAIDGDAPKNLGQLKKANKAKKHD